MATRIMEKQGWSHDNPRLGPAHNKGISEPIRHWGQQSKKGLGFDPPVAKATHKKEVSVAKQPTHNTKYVDAIPNFAMATAKNGTVPVERHLLVPGDVDGVVITTSFDKRPLEIDLPTDVTRQPAPTALKYRKEYLENSGFSHFRGGNNQRGRNFRGRNSRGRGNFRGSRKRGHSRGNSRGGKCKLVDRETWKFCDEVEEKGLNERRMEKAMRSISFVNQEKIKTEIMDDFKNVRL